MQNKAMNPLSLKVSLAVAGLGIAMIMPAMAIATMDGLVENVSLCGEGGISQARLSAAAHAKSSGENLGYHSTDEEERSFVQEFIPPEFPEDMRGNYVYGLALFSDDGCRLKINGRTVHDRFRKGQALPKLDQSFHDLPVLLTPGEPVQIELDYSNTHFITRPGFADIDGVTLYLYRVGTSILPDYNRDGVINDNDRGKVTEANPWRWWVNDDDDKLGVSGAWDGSGDTPGATGKWGDSKDNKVDGIRDLVDFFPLRLDVIEVLKKCPPEKFDYSLKHEDGAIKVCEVPFASPHIGKGAASHLLNIGTAKALATAKTHRTSGSGHKLSKAMLEALAAGKGMLLCEGVTESEAPLVLEVSDKESDWSFQLKLPLRISRVEQMYRYLNLRNRLANMEDHGKVGKLETQMGNPEDAYPDELTNGTYYVYLHGFANNSEVARAANAEIFKRLHQMGSRARYVGVSWYSNTAADYHRAVYLAFLTGDMLASELPKDGKIVIAAHSLGNMLASHAIEYGGLNVKNYFMINAASPIEAYDPNQTIGADGKDMQVFMTEKYWQSYLPHRKKLFAADWHGLFGAKDGRSKLTWKGRFAKRVPQVATNFYSTGEDVVRNPHRVFTVTGHMIRRMRDFNVMMQAWVAQEISKGNDRMDDLILKGTHAGWDFNHKDEEWKRIKKQDNWQQRIDDLVTKPLIREHPFYEPFEYPELYDPARGSAKAKEKNVQYKLLATAIPAMSYAVAANPVNAIEKNDNENINMMALKIRGHWPRGDEDGLWLHGDFRAVALCYVHQMYHKMIEIGGLDD